MTTPMNAESIANWAESQTPPAPAPRKPAGQGGHVSPGERREIQLAYLTTPGATVSRIARESGRTRETIAGCVKGEEFEKLRAEIWEQVRQEATQGLRGHVGSAVQGWGAAIGIAATKGDHKPSKELLEAVGVVEDKTASRFPQVNIVIGMPGKPAGPDPFAGLREPDGSVVIDGDVLFRPAARS